MSRIQYLWYCLKAFWFWPTESSLLS